MRNCVHALDLYARSALCCIKDFSTAASVDLSTAMESTLQAIFGCNKGIALPIRWGCPTWSGYLKRTLPQDILTTSSFKISMSPTAWTNSKPIAFCLCATSQSEVFFNSNFSLAKHVPWHIWMDRYHPTRENWPIPKFQPKRGWSPS